MAACLGLLTGAAIIIITEEQGEKTTTGVSLLVHIIACVCSAAANHSDVGCRPGGEAHLRHILGHWHGAQWN